MAPKLDIVFENSNLLAIDKPAGLAVHEGKTVSKRDSVLGILERQYRESQTKPQLVHRLDQDTSGLLLVAKNPKTAEELAQAFETGGVDKEYLALVVGRLALNQGIIDSPLPGRDGNPVRALTRYWVVKRYPEVTLVRVAIETGRLHQIRLHFAQLGHPVVMDDQHGDFAFNKTVSQGVRLEAAVPPRAKAVPQGRRQSLPVASKTAEGSRRNSRIAVEAKPLVHRLAEAFADIGIANLQLAHQHDAIAHRQQDILDARIAANSFVERV